MHKVSTSCFISSLLTLLPFTALSQSPEASSTTPQISFINYFLPTPSRGALSSNAWGATNVLPRDLQNGLEDTTIKQYCYWDGQITKAPDGKYHMFASRWAEARGHNGWFGSVAVHAVSDSLMGPYADKGPCWPDEADGRGHNVGAFTLPDGRYAIYISETRPCEVHVSKSLDGPWEHLGTITVEDEPRWHASNVSLMVRPDGKFEFTQRDGSIFTSDKGILGPYQRQSNSVYPKGIPNLEDPCIWYSGGLYHILVNSWSTRKAYHLTSSDGIHDWTNRGLAYDPREAIVRYPDGTVNHWNKVERPSVYIEDGHVIAMTLAAIDVEKEQDKGGDGHGSKVIVIPFDGAALDRDLQQTAASPPGDIPYSTMQVISNGDSQAVIAEKAARVLPRANQTEWMRLERTFFLHFGVNTFNEVEWGTGREEPTVFNPTALDAKQWLDAVTNFGGKMIVLVCKHHDGFCYWPTRYTAHSVAASPWHGGKGDEVREVADAARARGVKLAVYLSPADLYQLKTNPKNPAGYYGNGSSNVLSAIPTDPASFQSNPARGRAPTPGFTNYTYLVNDYNRYFLNQLYELLTEYGPIQEVWFDGANPDPSVHETYSYEAWYNLIRRLQPNAVIMGKGPDVRWVGNESGVGRATEWSVIPLPTAPDKFRWPDMTGGDLGCRAKLKPSSHLWWYPAEVNTTILQNNQWFWGRNKHPRTVTQLVDIFYTSVGRNGNLILNLSPDKRGLVPDNQLDALNKAAQIINETFANDLAKGGKLTADSSDDTHDPALVLDGNLDTWWEAAPGRTNGTVTLTLPRPVTFDVVSLQEAVDHRGQRIESFVIEAWNGTAWVAPEKLPSDDLTTVGHRRLVRLKAPATTDQVRIHITGARLEPTLAEMGLFKQSVATLPPTISDRSATGAVSLSNLAGHKMVYTLDGSDPTTTSAVYTGPIALPADRSITVRAASFLPDGKLGIVGSRVFAGIMPLGWKVVSVDSEETAAGKNSGANAIDGNSATFWHTRWNADQKQPHSITVDMGKTNHIGGFTYLPRQDGLLNGVVEKYRFETSADGVSWTTNIANSSFANIQNNPSLQEVSFAAVNARYFRFTSLRAIWGSGWTSAAEISVLPAQ